MIGYTKVDNWLFDTVMPAAKPGTFKLVSAVYRATVGWRKEWKVISLSDFQQLCGIDGRHNVVAAIKDALEHGWIERRPEGREFSYRPVVTNCDQGSHESLPNESQSVTDDSHESLPIDSHESLPSTSGALKESEEKKEDKETELPPIPPSYLRLIPVEIATQEFIATWGKWLLYQKELTGRELPQVTAMSQLQELKKYPVETAVAMMNQSIGNGWRGIFELKTNGSGGTHATRQGNNRKNYPEFQPVTPEQLEWWNSVNAGAGTDTT